MVRQVVKEIFNNKSLARTVTNISLSQVSVSGSGLDLGARSSKSSYYRFLKIEKDTHITFTDLHPSSENVIQLDLEKPFNVADSSQEFLLLMHTLEHLYKYEFCLSECHRILKPGGRLIGVVPYLHGYHPDPFDYFRYSQDSLKQVLSKCGYQKIEITPLGWGPFSAAADLILPFFYFSLIKAALAFVAISIDKFLFRLFPESPRVGPIRFPLAYRLYRQQIGPLPGS